MGDQKINKSLFLILGIVFLLGFSCRSLAQCAGSDNSVTVCNKDSDVSTRDFDLFANLGGAPTTGGTWETVNPANFFALNQNTGIVDLWRINNFGVHEFTYTNPNCGQSATVTVNLGGFPGENNIDGSANACSDNTSVNLHGFLGSEINGKVQDFNGLWEEDPATATGQLSDNIFDAEAAGPGVYEFTYTVDAVDTCPSRQSRVILEVHPAANPGLASIFSICINEDFSTYTNYNLNDLLTGEDSNGTWSEFGTNQLSNLSDSVVNIEELRDNFGTGNYVFRYTVFPSHPVCSERFAEVQISILPVLDGSLTAPNFCNDSVYTVELNYDETLLPNGVYNIDYSLTGSTGGSNFGEERVNLTNGTGTFNLDPLLVPTEEFITVRITDIDGVNPVRQVCSSISVTPATFLVSSPVAQIPNTCQNTDATVNLSKIFSTSGNYTNETHNINYTVNDGSGTVATETVSNVVFTNGDADFNISTSTLTVAGTYSVSFEVVGSLDTECSLETDFELIPIPEAIELDLIVDDNCNAASINVVVDAPIIADGSYTITYDVIELNTSNVLTTNTINFTGGTANYQIDVAALPQGNYTARVRSSQNDTTPCRIEFDFELTENFAKNGIPDIPTAEILQTFCLNEFLPDSPILADINVTANGQLFFYATATDMDILSLSTPLTDGEDYFVSNTDPSNNCESSQRLQITVLFSQPEAPTTTDATPFYCAYTNPTLANVNISPPTGGTIIWYGSIDSTTPLPIDTVLADNQSYFAATQEDICESASRLEIIPTVLGLELASLSSATPQLCGLDNPTISDLRNFESDNNYDILWYDVAENGTPLTDDTLLIENATYYAESFDPSTDCINPERTAATVDLSNCNPDDYGFFIPDGFSPNGDGRNDTFYIPNIQIIFPDFTLEILNRYGTTLFKGDINNAAWDGKNGSNTAPNGVYFYVIQYNKDGLSPIQGTLYLNQ